MCTIASDISGRVQSHSTEPLPRSFLESFFEDGVVDRLRKIVGARWRRGWCGAGQQQVSDFSGLLPHRLAGLVSVVRAHTAVAIDTWRSARAVSIASMHALRSRLHRRRRRCS